MSTEEALSHMVGCLKQVDFIYENMVFAVVWAGYASVPCGSFGSVFQNDSSCGGKEVSTRSRPLIWIGDLNVAADRVDAGPQPISKGYSWVDRWSPASWLDWLAG